MNIATADPVGDLATALAHASRLMTVNPDLAAEQAREILKAVPQQPAALLLLCATHRARRRFAEARDLVAPLAQAQPDWAEAQFEWAMCLAGLGEDKAALAALRRAVAARPNYAEAWRTLGDRLTLQGDSEGADDAYAQSIRAGVTDPRLMNAASALCNNKLAIAEHTLRAHLIEYPTDVAAIRMFAEVAARLGRYVDAEKLLVRCLELAPSFNAARYNLAMVRFRANKAADALPDIERLLAIEPEHPNYRALQAAALSHLGEYEKAAAVYASVLKDYPGQPHIWISYGHSLKTSGQLDDSVAAYRKSIELKPGYGEAWWSLANLKTISFSDGDVDAMNGALLRADIGDSDRVHLHYALGKALEDRRAYADAFAHYAQGAQLRHGVMDYDPELSKEHVLRAKAFFTPALLRARAGQGSPAPDPIFIVGLPRSGSTLIEQILSSHSQIEGTMELPDLGRMVKRVGERKTKRGASKYPEILDELSPDQLRELGEEYLATTRIQRKTAKPFYIDKLPNNFLHTGFIRLILPNAKIIDARRHPMGACFSSFKQHYSRGQGSTYDLGDLGRFYRDYVELMAHFDRVAPGRVHRVIYEHMVADTEAQVRRLLDYCGVAFEPNCLRFYENDRAVRTPSSEQVRQPIYTGGVEHWRHFEPWLGPLKQALGSVVDAYPMAPPEFEV